jgi:hypothetical protein
VEAVWPLAEPFIARACSKVETDLTPEFIRTGCETGRYRLWLVLEDETPVSAFAIAELPNGIAEFTAFAADRFEEWLPMVLAEFASMAEASGMKALRIHGRLGWMRRMQPYGFRTVKREGRTVIMDMVL